jgi:hypothetical protein
MLLFVKGARKGPSKWRVAPISFKGGFEHSLADRLRDRGQRLR